MMMHLRSKLAAAALIAATALSVSAAHAQQKSEVSLSRQPGIFYMPSHIMEKQKLTRSMPLRSGYQASRPNGSPSPAAARRPMRCSQAASTSSTPAPAICCCCGTAPAAA
ncbi:hypothetical protein ACVIQT_001783 [Bradyrhizobium diazoefficiens]